MLGELGAAQSWVQPSKHVAPSRTLGCQGGERRPHRQCQLMLLFKPQKRKNSGRKNQTNKGAPTWESERMCSARGVAKLSAAQQRAGMEASTLGLPRGLWGSEGTRRR